MIGRGARATTSALGERRPPDLRLVGFALGTWLAAYAALRGSAPTVAGAVVVAAAVAGGLGGWFHSGRQAGARPVWPRLVVVVLLGMICGGAATGVRLHARDAAVVAQPAAERMTVTAVLVPRRDPRELRRPAPTPTSWLLPAWLLRVESPELPPVGLRVRVLVLAGDPGWRRVRPGERVRVTGRLAPPRGGDLTAALLVVDDPPEVIGDAPWWQRGAGSLRSGLRSAVAPLPEQPGGLLPGLAFGDVSQLDPGLRDDFFATGMSHLVAVSGTHTAIVVGFVYLLARAARAPPWATAVLCGAAVVGYVIVCQASPSVLRAGVMGAVALVALVAGRARAAMPALAATVVVLIVGDPQLATTPGFALSVCATAGLLLWAPRWRDGLRRRGVPAGLAEALAVPAAAQVAVSPMIAGMSGTISLVAVAANLVAAPVMAVATLLAVSAAVVAPVWTTGAELLAWLGSWPAWWLVLVARYGAQAPAAVVPWPGGWPGGLLLAGLTGAFLLAARLRLVRRLVAVTAAAAVVGALPVSLAAGGWPPRDAVLVVCAVGQGDLLVLPVGAGAAVVIDAGPDPTAADRCLRDLGVSSVPLFVVSHFHLDHVGGVAGVFRSREVAAVLTTAWPEPEHGHSLVATTAAASGAPVVTAAPDGVYRVGDATLAVLTPAYDQVGTRSDPNNNSLVLRVEAAGVRLLLTGDAEVELQTALLAVDAPAVLRADILKVAHHGSAFQSEAFLDAVAPTVAMVPVGADNPYGHPSPAVLGWLERRGVRVLRTDIDGDVAAVRSPTGGLGVVSRQLPPGPGR